MASMTHDYLDGFFSPEAGEDSFLREGFGRKALYENVAVFIEPGQRIVGQLARGLSTEIVLNQVNAHHRMADRFERLMADGGVAEEVRRAVRERYERMKAYALQENLRELADESERLVADSGAALAQEFNGHMVLDYAYALRRGLDGMLQDIAQAASARAVARPAFYDALRLTVEGMQAYIRRHAELAERLANQPDCDGQWLREIAAVCRHVAHSPPETFHQAVQLQWFLMTFGDYDSFGRYDQYMAPFYDADIAAGRLTRDHAKLLLRDMLTRIDELGGAIINMTLGGLTGEGGGAVNEFTYVVLEAVREAGYRHPNLCLRLTAQSDERLWREAMVSLSTGQALPALYNDDVFIPMLRRQGIAKADANEYTLAGCSQAIIPGRSNYACDMGLYTPAKMLDLALHNGFDTRLGKQVGPHTGEAAELDTFDKLYAAYSAQVKYCVAKGVSLNDQDMAARRDHLSCVRTLLTRDCLERGLGIFEGGAEYNGIQGEVIGLTNTANALLAVKQLVYEEGAISLPELVAALDRNFAGEGDPSRDVGVPPARGEGILPSQTPANGQDVPPWPAQRGQDARVTGDEHLRRRCQAVPKFGNGHEASDAMRVQITREFYSELASHRTALGGVHWPGEVIFLYHMTQAPHVGALPDGKLAGQPLADSAGAAQGTDTQGLTALLRSCAKLPTDATPFTSINLNLRFDKTTWQAQHHRDHYETAFKTYFALGGCQLQVNVLHAHDLADAMANPDHHKNLVVRVGGFSAYFTQLNRALQQEIVSRTETA